MKPQHFAKPEVLLPIARVACLVNLPSESVRYAIREGQLRAEAVPIGDKLGFAIPLTAVSELWDLPAAKVREIESEVRSSDLKSPSPIVTQLLAWNRDAALKDAGYHRNTANSISSAACSRRKFAAGKSCSVVTMW